jgi:hypothetical protein
MSVVAEVIVTARKREENLQEVPDSITAMGALELEEGRVSAIRWARSSRCFPATGSATARGRPRDRPEAHSRRSEWTDHRSCGLRTSFGVKASANFPDATLSLVQGLRTRMDRAVAKHQIVRMRDGADPAHARSVHGERQRPSPEGPFHPHSCQDIELP